MKYTFLLIQICIFIQVISQTPTQQWLNRFNGDGDFSDKYNCVLTDNNGNVYLGGYTVNAKQRKDYLLTKYTNTGSFIWSVTMTEQIMRMTKFYQWQLDKTTGSSSRAVQVEIIQMMTLLQFLMTLTGK
ncbi:MAG: hypothetical protein ACKO6A_02770 [Bacteroidota bacterium]